jgi:hypothetical protein
MGGDEKMCGGLILLRNRRGVFPFFGDLRLARPHLPPCGGESEIEELARSGPNLRFRKRGAR